MQDIGGSQTVIVFPLALCLSWTDDDDRLHIYLIRRLMVDSLSISYVARPKTKQVTFHLKFPGLNVFQTLFIMVASSEHLHKHPHSQYNPCFFFWDLCGWEQSNMQGSATRWCLFSFSILLIHLPLFSFSVLWIYPSYFIVITNHIYRSPHLLKIILKIEYVLVS